VILLQLIYILKVHDYQRMLKLWLLYFDSGGTTIAKLFWLFTERLDYFSIAHDSKYVLLSLTSTSWRWAIRFQP